MIKAMKNKIIKNVSGFESRSYSVAEKQNLLKYMKSFEPFAVAGLVCDCVSGEQLPDENVGYTDGEFSWCSQDIYHIENYNAAVSDEFFEKIK